jgi:hypothetical protein
MSVPAPAPGRPELSATDWLHDARWGLMLHFLADAPSSAGPADMTPDAWDRRVDAVDADAVAGQLADAGAGYVIFTVGQCSGYFCSPNATYDALVPRPRGQSRLSRRDLVADLADACGKLGVRVIAYLPSHAPSHDVEACVALGCTPDWDAGMWGLKRDSYTPVPGVDERLTHFQRRWEAVLREYSVRWGGRVSGWWIDGCYYADRMYRNANGDAADEASPSFGSFAAALRAGNARALVAFNPGVREPVRPHTKQEDYTAGEVNSLSLPVKWAPWSRFVDGAQLHMLSFLGGFWNDPTSDKPRMTDELAAAYTRQVNLHGGAMTWDVPIDDRALIRESFRRQVAAIGGG